MAKATGTPRGGQAFVVALGVDLEGKKLPLGFWEGATENHEICEELLEGTRRRARQMMSTAITGRYHLSMLQLGARRR